MRMKKKMKKRKVKSMRVIQV